MNRIELEAVIAERKGISRFHVTDCVDALFEAIKETLARGEPVRITNFGTFTVKDRAQRQGKNPKTGEDITIKASRKVSLRPGKELNAAVNAGRR